VSTYAEFIWARLAEADERDPEPDPEKKRKNARSTTLDREVTDFGT
jgi:hypothetical protein